MSHPTSPKYEVAHLVERDAATDIILLPARANGDMEIQMPRRNLATIVVDTVGA